MAEQRQRKRARLAALAWLKVAYPAPVRLSAAAARDRNRQADLGRRPTRRREAQRSWRRSALPHVHRQAYLAALAADGAMRFGLDGQPVGPVEPEHRTEALKLLAVIVEIKARRSAPVDREHRLQSRRHRSRIKTQLA